MLFRLPFCLLVFAQAAAAARRESSPGVVEEIPDCGVATTYAVLKLLDRPASLSELEGRFRALRANVNLHELSLADVRAVLQGFGLHVRAVRIEPREVASVPLPAIVYLRPERIGRARGPGHFVILCSVKDATAEMLDLTAARGRIQVPLELLGRTSHGELLAVSRRPFGPSPKGRLGLALLLYCLASAAAVVWGILHRRSGDDKPLGVGLH